MVFKSRCNVPEVRWHACTCGDCDRTVARRIVKEFGVVGDGRSIPLLTKSLNDSVTRGFDSVEKSRGHHGLIELKDRNRRSVETFRIPGTRPKYINCHRCTERSFRPFPIKVTGNCVIFIARSNVDGSCASSTEDLQSCSKKFSGLFEGCSVDSGSPAFRRNLRVRTVL